MITDAFYLSGLSALHLTGEALGELILSSLDSADSDSDSHSDSDNKPFSEEELPQVYKCVALYVPFSVADSVLAIYFSQAELFVINLRKLETDNNQAEGRVR